MGESEGVSKGGLMGESEERGSFRLVLGEGIVSVLEPCSSVLINPTRTLECFFLFERTRRMESMESTVIRQGAAVFGFF